MSTPPERHPFARVYIQERLEERGWDQKTLARHMRRSEGAVSKKLARPDLIDMQWLAEFAAAFRVNVVEMFQPPGGSQVRVLSPKMAEFFELVSGFSDNQLDSLADIYRAMRGLAPPQEESPASEATQLPKATSAR